MFDNTKKKKKNIYLLCYENSGLLFKLQNIDRFFLHESCWINRVEENTKRNKIVMFDSKQ